MAYDGELAGRVRALLSKRKGMMEKKMFGGLTFMLDGRMCCGILKDELMVRVLHERYEELLKRPSAREMDITGRPMKGFLLIGRGGLKTEPELKSWVDEVVRFLKESPVKGMRRKK